MTASRPLSFLLMLLGLLCVLTTAPARASSQDLLGSLGIETQPRFLKVDQAFALESEQQGDRLLLRIRIADGYYLYRHSIRVKGENLAFDEPVLPPGTEHEDDFFGKSRVYYQEVQIPVALTRVGDAASLTLSYQGCTEGLCYPPTDKRIAVEPLAAPARAEAPASLQGTDVPGSQQDRLAAALGSQGFWISVAAFFALGLGLVFTPCVFPMYPILTGIIAGAGHRLSTRRAFLLSFVYVQGMAVTYTLLGLVVASAGLQFQAALQHPYVLIGLSVMFVLLALSMFGLYTLQLPSSLQTRLSGFSNRQQGGSVAGVAIMGMISGLVCSPCTTAPLSGALIYVAQSGDLWLGGAALYALSLGMGLPLLLLGTSGGKLLPRAGAWMDVIKQLFGFALLAVPILLLSRLLSDQMATLLWLGWGLVLCGYLYHHNQHRSHSVGKSLGGFVLLLGMMGLVVWWARICCCHPRGPMPPPRPRPPASFASRPWTISRCSLPPPAASRCCWISTPTGAWPARSSSTRPSATPMCRRASARWCCCRRTSPPTTTPTWICSTASTCWDCRPSSSSIAMATR